jgi:hypothetical protein
MKNVKKHWKTLNWTICLWMALGAVALFVIGAFIKNTVLSSILTNIASVILVSGIVSVANEYVLKTELMDIIFTNMNVKDDMKNTGLVKIFLDINKVDYEKFFDKTNKEIDIVHVYGRSWTAKHLKMFCSKVTKERCSIRVFLISPDSEYVKPLSEFYRMTEEQLKANMNEVLEMWKQVDEKCKKGGKGNIKVYYHKGNPSHALYRSDNSVMLVPNNLASGRDELPPAFLYTKTEREGIYKWCLIQINKLVDESQQII